MVEVLENVVFIVAFTFPLTQHTNYRCDTYCVPLTEEQKENK